MGVALDISQGRGGGIYSRTNEPSVKYASAHHESRLLTLINWMVLMALTWPQLCPSFVHGDAHSDGGCALKAEVKYVPVRS